MDFKVTTSKYFWIVVWETPLYFMIISVVSPVVLGFMGELDSPNVFESKV